MKFLSCLLVSCLSFLPLAHSAQALKKTIDGQSCLKLSTHNPVWSFKQGASSTSGDFDLKWGKNPNQSGTTGLCSNRTAFVFINIAGCQTQQNTLEGCPFYLPGVVYTFVTQTNDNGNVLIPLNGQDILNAGGNAAFQAFVVDTQGCVDPQFGIIEIHASPLCTVHDVNANPIYACN